MRLIKYVLFFLILIQPIAAAQDIRVLYFYNTENVLPEDLTTQIQAVKDKWKNQVIWQELDYSNESQRAYFEKYNIFSLPVAVVECYKSVERVNRSEKFAEELNKTIYDCTLPKIPMITETVGMTTITGRIGYQEKIKVESYGIYIFVGLAILLVIFLYRLLYKKAG